MSRKVSKQEWIDALRSGEYKQARGVARNMSGFCCLGVLADLAGCEWEVSDRGVDYNGMLDGFSVYDGINQPVLDLIKAAREKSLAPLSFFEANKFAKKLARANDDGQDFEEIADTIEETL